MSTDRNHALAAIRGLLFTPSPDAWQQIVALTAHWDDAAYERELHPYLTTHLEAWPPELLRTPHAWLHRILEGEHEPRLDLCQVLDLAELFEDVFTDALYALLESDWSGYVGVDLRGNPIEEESLTLLQTIVDSPDMRWLDLGYCGFVDETLEFLFEGISPELTWLGLADFQGSGDALRMLPSSLEALHLHGSSALSDAPLFPPLPSLHTLSLTFARVTPHTFDHLVSRELPTSPVRELRLAGTAVDAETLVAFELDRRLPSLARLDLRYCCLTDSLAEILSKNSTFCNLDTLELEGNLFTPVFIGDLPYLLAHNPPLSQRLQSHALVPHPDVAYRASLFHGLIDDPASLQQHADSLAEELRRPRSSVAETLGALVDIHGEMMDVEAAVEAKRFLFSG